MPPFISWDEVETSFARSVLLFVCRETGGLVSWFARHEDGTWRAVIQFDGRSAITLIAKSEETLAVKYWEHYHKQIKKNAGRYSGLWGAARRCILNRKKYEKDQEALRRWKDWRSAHAEHFPK